MSDHDADPLAEVRMLLTGAGITAPDGDLASLQRVLGTARRRMERMYAVDTGDAVPAAVFRAELDGEVGL